MLESRGRRPQGNVSLSSSICALQQLSEARESSGNAYSPTIVLNRCERMLVTICGETLGFYSREDKIFVVLHVYLHLHSINQF